jgi:hypothetical protein
MIQVATHDSLSQIFKGDYDLTLKKSATQNAEQILDLLVTVASRQLTPKAVTVGNTDFQFTRGLLGVSM